MKKILVLVLCFVFGLAIVGAMAAQQYRPPPPRPSPPPQHHYNPPQHHYNPPQHQGPHNPRYRTGPGGVIIIEDEPPVSEEFVATGGGCFVATAVYGDYNAGEVKILREFRDSRLLTSDFGKKIVAFYYENGPIAAKFVDEHPYVKPLLKLWFLPVVGVCYVFG
jgi:hypothetical protein